jgi:hypothetical protein
MDLAKGAVAFLKMQSQLDTSCDLPARLRGTAFETIVFVPSFN